jgi:hypothetical protein
MEHREILDSEFCSLSADFSGKKQKNDGAAVLLFSQIILKF